MTAHSPVRIDDHCSNAFQQSSLPLFAGAGVILLVTAARMSGTVDSDVASQLWIAERLQQGANLYTDIIETNPPLWFWMGVPVERLAELVHVRAEPMLVSFISALILLAIAATNSLLARVPAKQRSFLLAYTGLALAAVPWMHVGQREQLVLIGTVPYAALIAARSRAETVPAWLSALVGLGAGLAFALKHYFLIVPALLELWLITARRRSWRLVRVETTVMALVGACYALAVLAFERDYVTHIIPLLKLSYGSFGGANWSAMFGPFGAVGLLLLIVMVMQGRVLARGDAPLSFALAVAATAFGAIYFIQFKGWHYHAIPLIGCASLSLAALLSETRTSQLLRLFAPALLILPLALAAEEQLHPALPNADLREAVRGLHRGEPVGFLTIEPAIPWSVTFQAGYRYASRYNGLWLMPAVIRNEVRGNPDARLSDLGRKIVSDTVDDYTCIRPRRIIIERAPGNAFDLLAFFRRDPKFVELLSHYRLRSRSALETYELVTAVREHQLPCGRGL